MKKGFKFENGGNHQEHPKCEYCGRALYKSMTKGTQVLAADPWAYCRNINCDMYAVDQDGNGIDARGCVRALAQRSDTLEQKKIEIMVKPWTVAVEPEEEELALPIPRKRREEESKQLELVSKKISEKKVPLKKVPAGKVPAGKVPAKKVPLKKVPAGKVPAKKVPLKKVPAGKVPAGKVPAKKVPLKKVPAGKVPAGKVPAKKIMRKPEAKKVPMKPGTKKVPMKPGTKKVPMKPGTKKVPMKRRPDGKAASPKSESVDSAREALKQEILKKKAEREKVGNNSQRQPLRPSGKKKIAKKPSSE